MSFVQVSCTVHTVNQRYLEIKGIWIVQCFHGLVGLVLHEQGAWTPLIHWAPQLKEIIAAWGKVDSCRRTHLQQTASRHSCHAVQYLPISADARTIVKWACTQILLNLPQILQWTLSKCSSWLTFYIYIICTGESHTWFLPPPNLHLFFFPSAFLSTLSLGPYSISITQHCINITSKNWALQKINPKVCRNQCHYFRRIKED